MSPSVFSSWQHLFKCTFILATRPCSSFLYTLHLALQCLPLFVEWVRSSPRHFLFLFNIFLKCLLGPCKEPFVSKKILDPNFLNAMGLRFFSCQSKT